MSREPRPSTFGERLAELHAAATPGPWTLDIQSEGGWEYGNPTSLAGIVAPDPSPLPQDRQIAGGVYVVRFDDDYGTDQGADSDLIVYLRNHAEAILALVKEAELFANVGIPDGQQQKFLRALEALDRG